MTSMGGLNSGAGGKSCSEAFKLAARSLRARSTPATSAEPSYQILSLFRHSRGSFTDAIFTDRRNSKRMGLVNLGGESLLGPEKHFLNWGGFEYHT